MRYVIGLDVGTTGTKAVVCDQKGKIYGNGYMEYNLSFKNNGKVTQNANDWYSAACFAVKKAVATSGIDPLRIEAISMSTQGASMLCVDKNLEPLCDVITWMDKSTELEVKELVEHFGEEKLYRKSGWQLSTSNDLPKILYLKRNCPVTFKNTCSFVSTLEFMNLKMTGRNITDPTNAAIRSLTDISAGTYDRELLDYVGIDESKLPIIAKTGSEVANLSQSCAKDFGLHTGVKVINGAHDQYCASIGAGAIKSGDMLVATGTTWVVLGIADRLIYTPSRVCPGIHPADGLYGVMATLISAGSALKWYKNIIGTDYSEIDRGAEKCRDSAKDVLFAPYLAGVGFPHKDKTLKSHIVGLNLSHSKYDIALSLMEGVAFEAKNVLEEYKKFGCEVKELTMTGRTAHSNLWRGLVRDITNCNITFTQEPDTCCVGAAIIAAVGAGIYKNYAEACSNMVKTLDKEAPIKENVEFYTEKYHRYKDIFGEN